jgi:MoaA/NifB/PqqE/SkfB family radical SAM enzyme
MPSDILEIVAPWRLNEQSEIILTVRDKSLLGSKRHIVRFDIYPIHAPSHPERHYGFWDIPMRRLQRERTVLTLKNERIYLHRGLFPSSYEAVWRGALPLAGTCFLTVSVLDISSDPAQTLFTKSSAHLLPDTDNLPLLRATLYITRRCNLKCDLCWREFFQTRDYVDTPSSVIDSVLEVSPQLTSVLLHGDGEPLLNPDLPHILTAFRRTISSTGKIGLHTNGMLLDQKLAPDLIDRGVDWLSISMDGATKSTFESIRRGSHFETIVENVRDTVNYGKKNRPGEVQFTILFTARESNIRELPGLVRLAGDLGIDNVVVGGLILYDTGEFRVVPLEVLEPVYREARRVGSELGVNLTLQSPRPFGQPRCHFLQEMFVHVSGDVTICSFRKPGKPEEPMHILGNVTQTPLLEIWNSAGCKELRSMVMTGAFPEGCATCGFKVWGCPMPV